MKGKTIIAIVAAVILVAAGAYYFFIHDPDIIKANNPPVAEIRTDSRNVNANETVSFSAADSVDEDGSIVYYKWDFGDGGSSKGKDATHTYGSGGTYTVTLTVIDDDGDIATKAMDVRVNSPPRPIISVEKEEGHVGETVTFDASMSSDPDGNIASCQWDFGDGGTGAGRKASHKYTSLGDYSVRLTLKDDRNATVNTTLEFPVVEREFRISWDSEETTLVQRSNTTTEGATSTEIMNVERENMLTISFILTWSDTLPIPAPLNLRENTPDEFNMTVAMGPYFDNVSGTSESLRIDIALAAAPENTTVTATDKDTAEDYARSSFTSTSGVGQWAAAITAVECGDGLLFNGGVFPDNSNSWDLEVKCTYFVPSATEI